MSKASDSHKMKSRYVTSGHVKSALLWHDTTPFILLFLSLSPLSPLSLSLSLSLSTSPSLILRCKAAYLPMALQRVASARQARGEAQTLPLPPSLPSQLKPTQQQSTSNPSSTSAGERYTRSTNCVHTCVGPQWGCVEEEGEGCTRGWGWRQTKHLLAHEP